MGKSEIRSEIIKFVAEKILETWIDKGKRQYNIQSRKKRLDIYMADLEEKCLLKYNDSVLYDELFRILKRQDSLEKLLIFCQNQDSQKANVTAQHMISDMIEDCTDIYIRSQIKEILNTIYQEAFAFFNDIEDDNFFRLKNYLEREGREIRQKIDNQSRMQDEILSAVQKKVACLKTTPEEITFAPPKPVTHFLGREDEIRDIEKIVDKHLHNSERLACWIYGMGGIGKTQLCRMLYLKLRERFSFIGWIPYQGGDFRTSLVEALHLPYEKSSGKTLEERYLEALQYLQRLNTKALLFIDNYDSIMDCRIDIERFSCHVIISSRSKNPDMFVGYSLGFLPLRKCKKLFRNFYTLQEQEDGILNEIIHLAGYLTIAVELLAKTARKQNLTLLELYETLQRKAFDIHTVLQSNWDNTGEALQEELTKHFEIIFDISSICRDVQKIYILQNFSILPYLSVGKREAVEWLALEEETGLLSDLADSGWLEESDDCAYSMHPLISYTMKKNAPPMVSDCLPLIRSLGKKIHADEECNYLEIFFYLTYADAVGKYFREHVVDTNNALCRLLCELAVAFKINGEYSVGYEWGEDAICHMAEMNSVDAALPNMIYNTMAEICLDMRNRNPECKEWAKKAVAYDEEHAQELSDILRSNSFHNLGCAYIQLRDNGQAIKWEEKALELRQKHFSEIHVSVLNALRNLAMVYRREERVQEAFETQHKVIRNLLELHRDNLNHPDLPVAYNIYSFILRDLNNLQGAICYQRAAVRIREHNNVKDPKLAINYNNLGVFLREYGNLEKALFFQIKAIEMDLRLRGPDHIDLATDYYNYALILYEKKDYAQALLYLDEAHRIEKLAGTEDLAYIEELRQKINKVYSVTER